MSEAPALRSRRFREAREEDWRALERLLAKLEAGSLKRLDDEALIALPRLYRAALSSLSTARAVSLDAALIAYLEALCRRAYFAVYGVRTRPVDGALDFFARGWPTAVRALAPETLIAAAILLAGAMTAFIAVGLDPESFHAFIPQALAGGREPGATTAALLAPLHSRGPGSGLAAFASYLFTNNAQVAIGAFALGFVFGAPTAGLLFWNGGSLGALLAVYAPKGLALPLLAWLLIHGVTELFAITLAGAAGLRLARALVFPGERTRVEALQTQGQIAATAMAGVLVMLVCAGALEGFGRQLVQDDLWRWAIAAATALGWGLYVYGPWTRRR